MATAPEIAAQLDQFLAEPASPRQPVGSTQPRAQARTGSPLPGQPVFADHSDLDSLLGIAEKPSIFGEFTRGLGAGASQIRTDLIGARAVFNQATGDQQQTDELVRLIQEREHETAAAYPKTVQRIEDVGSTEDFVRFTARALGEQVPVVASIIAGGGGAGLVGRLVGKKLISRQIATQLAKQLPSKAAAAGAIGTATTIETGVTAEEQISATGEINPGVALTAGAAKGALEAIVPAALGFRFGLTPDLSRGLIGKMVKTFDRVVPSRIAAIPVVGVTEGITETLQETIDIAAREFVDENYDSLGPDARSRLLNSAATGAIVGSVLGPLFGGGGRSRPLQEQSVGQEGGVATDEQQAPGGTAPGVDETEGVVGLDISRQISDDRPRIAGLLPPPAPSETSQGPVGLLPPPPIAVDPRGQASRAVGTQPEQGTFFATQGGVSSPILTEVAERVFYSDPTGQASEQLQVVLDNSSQRKAETATTGVHETGTDLTTVGGQQTQIEMQVDQASEAGKVSERELTEQIQVQEQQQAQEQAQTTVPDPTAAPAVSLVTDLTQIPEAVQQSFPEHFGMTFGEFQVAWQEEEYEVITGPQPGQITVVPSEQAEVTMKNLELRAKSDQRKAEEAALPPLPEEETVTQPQEQIAAEPETALPVTDIAEAQAQPQAASAAEITDEEYFNPSSFLTGRAAEIQAEVDAEIAAEELGFEVIPDKPKPKKGEKFRNAQALTPEAAEAGFISQNESLYELAIRETEAIENTVEYTADGKTQSVSDFSTVNPEYGKRRVRLIVDKSIKSGQQKKMHDFFTNVLDELNIDTHLTVYFGPKPQQGDIGSTENFNLLRDEGAFNADIIQIQSNLPQETVVSTAIHELGHLVMRHHFATAPQETQRELLDAHSAAKQKALDKFQTFLTEFVSPFEAVRLLGEGSVEEQITRARERTYADVDYTFSFNEWMAEQLVRSQINKSTRLDATGRFFRELGGLLRKAINSGLKNFGITAKTAPEIAKQFTADKAFNNFLKHIKGQHREFQNAVSREHAKFNLNVESQGQKEQRLQRKRKDFAAGVPTHTPNGYPDFYHPDENIRRVNKLEFVNKISNAYPGNLSLLDFTVYIRDNQPTQRQLEDYFEFPEKAGIFQKYMTHTPEGFRTTSYEGYDVVPTLDFFHPNLAKRENHRKRLITRAVNITGLSNGIGGFKLVHLEGIIEDYNLTNKQLNDLFKDPILLQEYLNNPGVRTAEALNNTVQGNFQPQFFTRVAKIKKGGDIRYLKPLTRLAEKTLPDISEAKTRVVGILDLASSEVNSDYITRAHNIINLYDSLLKELKIKMNLIVKFGRADRYQGYAAGHPEYDEQGNFVHQHQVIALDINIQNADESFVAGTVLHEFGHAIAMTEFSKAPFEIKEAIIEAYNKYRTRVESSQIIKGYESFVTEFLSPERSFQQALPHTYADTTQVEGLFADIAVDDAKYWLSFEEWIADQAVKININPATQFDSVTKFFVNLGTILRESLRKIYGRLSSIGGFSPEARKRFLAREQSLDPRKHGASDAYVEFIQYLKSRSTEQSDAQRSMQTQQQLVMAANQRVLARMGIEGFESAGPPTAATEATDTLLRKMNMRKALREEIRAPADKMNWFMKIFLTVQQIALENPHIAPLAHYVELIDRWYVEQMDWISKADQTLKKWIGLGTKQSAALGKFIFAIDNMDYLGAKELEARLPTEQEVATLAQEYGVNEEGLNLYQRIRDDLRSTLDHVRQIAERDAGRTIKDPTKLAAEIQKIKEEFDLLANKPYFPHSRFGEFAVVVRDKQTGLTDYIEHFDSNRQAKAKLQEIASGYPEATTVIRQVPKIAQTFQGLPSVMLEQIRDKLAPGLSEEQNGWLDDYIHELSLSTGLRKKLAKRRGIGGYSTDAMRSYANYFFTNAKYFARLEYGHQLEATIQALEQENANLPDLSDATKRDRMRDYMSEHYHYIMNPKSEWAGLRSFAFMWWLGFHVKSAVLNFTQVPMVAYPYLAGQHGDLATLNALKKAIVSLPRLYKGQHASLGDELIAGLSRGVKEGVIDESQATELAGIAQGSYLQRIMPGNKAQRFQMMFSHYGAYMFQTAEKINRRTVFRAGWDLALRPGANPEYLQKLVDDNPLAYAEMTETDGLSREHAIAYLAAKDAVRSSQYQYSAHARPAFMRGKKGTLFTFFMYAQQTLYFAARQPGRVRFWMIMLAAGGLMGLPGGDDLMAIAKFIGKKLLGQDFDPERELREIITDIAEDRIPPDLILHGTSRYGFGIPAAMDAMGLPKSQFDLSASVSLGQVIPGLQEVMNPSGMGFEANFSRAGTDIAGAAFGPGINILKALSDGQYPIDDLKRWERAMPRALANVAKARRFLLEERERTRTGATVVDFDPTDADHLGEIALQSMGFSSTRIAQRWSQRDHGSRGAKLLGCPTWGSASAVRL